MASVRNNALPFGKKLAAILQAKQRQASLQNARAQEQHIYLFAVIAHIRSVQGANEAMRAFLHVFLAIRPAFDGILRLDAHHRFELRHVDRFATAGFLTLQQGGERHAERVKCGGIIAREWHGRNRRLALNAVHAHCATERLSDRVITRALHVALYARLSKTRNMGNDQARIHRPQRLVAKALARKAPSD